MVIKGVIIKRVYVIKTKMYQNFPQKKVVHYTYCSIDIYLNVLTIFAFWAGLRPNFTKISVSQNLTKENPCL